MTSATERMPRLLALVPYLLSRPGVLVSEAAADFGVSETQLRRDLELLWMCGLPGYGPGDLIDLSFDSDTITVTYDAGMRRPLQLTAPEATSLTVALHALLETPGIADTDAVRRTLAKIENAVGQARPSHVVVRLSEGEGVAPPEIRDTVRRAASARFALRLRYYTASRDAITERVVDPIRVVIIEAHSYLEAWCRNAEAVRLFRLDRIDAATTLDEPARPPENIELTDFTEGVFRPDPDQPSAVLEVDMDARWVAEYYRVDESEDLPGGGLRIRLRYSDEAWMVRLVLGLGAQARVVSPPELAARVRAQAEEALARSRHLPVI